VAEKMGKTDTQTNGGKNLITATAVGVVYIDLCRSMLASMSQRARERIRI